MNRKFLVLMFFGMLLLSVNLAAAAVSWGAPTIGSNHSSNISLTVYFVNETDIIDPTSSNTTLYYNTTTTGWTQVNFAGFAQNGSQVTGTLDITSIADGSNISLNMTLGNDSTILGGVVVTALTIDDTPPAVSFVGSTFVSGGNYSGSSIIINTSVNDSLIGMSSVYFNITNSTGTQVNWSKATSAGGYYSLTFDSTALSDGVYNLTIYANDSLNNLNSSIVRSVTFDNSNPSVSFSCTPTSTNVGSVITCTCTGSDSLSGVSSTTYTKKPSTSSIGTFTTNCTVVDRAGNSATSSIEYKIISGGGAVGSSPSAANFWTAGTHTLSQEQFKQGFTKKLKVKSRMRFEVNGKNHHVGIKELTETSVTIEIASEPIEVTLGIGEDAKADVDDDGYYDVYVKLNNIKQLSEKIVEGEGAVSTTGEIGKGREVEKASWWQRFINWLKNLFGIGK